MSKHSTCQIFRRAAVTLVALVWSSLAFGGIIHNAVVAGNMEMVKALLKADPGLITSKDTNSDWTPLHFAASIGRTDMIELLLSNKADVNAKDNIGKTPLHWAALDNHKGRR